MIDVQFETLLTIKQAREEFPNRPSIPTLWRWMLKGVGGAVLESVRIGGRRFTSKEAVSRFLEVGLVRSATPDRQHRRDRRHRAICTARAVLDQFGV